MESFKPLIAKVAAGATLSRAEAEERVQLDALGRSDAIADGRISDGAEGARGDGRRDHRRCRSDAGEDDWREGAARCNRHRRHRRRRFGLLQCLDAGRDHHRRLRRPGRQAWQSRRLLALGRRGHARRARGQDRACAGRRRTVHPRGRDRLHDGAGASCIDAPCRPDAGRARHAHDLQSAWTALQSGRRQTPDRWRLLGRLARADGRGACGISAPSASG